MVLDHLVLGDVALGHLALAAMALDVVARSGFGVLRLVILDRELDRPSIVHAFDSLAQLLLALLPGGFVIVLLVAPDDRADEREAGQSLDRESRYGAHFLADLRRQIVQSIEQPLVKLVQADADGRAA